MGRMRYPSLSLHGIEGAFCEFCVLLITSHHLKYMSFWCVDGAGCKTVIPASVHGEP